MRLLALSLVGTLAWAQSPVESRDDFFKLPGLLWDDARTVAAAPGSWTSSDWKEAGVGAAAVLGVALVFDHTLDAAAARNRTPSRDRLARGLSQPGGTGGLLFMGAGYVGCSLLDKPEARSVFVDMGIATVLAQVAILPLKLGAGRYRPVDGEGADHFRPFSGKDSFPSGHAAQAFAMASAAAAHSSEPWVGWCAYGAAGLVGLSRLETRDHFASDVVAGALVGTFMGRTVVRIHDGFRPGRARFTFTPALGPGFTGLTLAARF